MQNFTKEQLQDVEFLSQLLNEIDSNISLLTFFKDAKPDRVTIDLSLVPDQGNIYENNCLYLNQTIIPYNLNQEIVILLSQSLQEWQRRLYNLQDIVNNANYIIVAADRMPLQYLIQIDKYDNCHFTGVKSAATRYSFFELIDMVATIKENNLQAELIN